MFSAPYRCDQLAGLNTTLLLGLQNYVVVTPKTASGSTIIVHAAPGAASPDGSAPIFGGTETPWTWGQFAAAQPALALLCRPHEWAGENTAADVVGINDPRFFPNPQPMVTP